MNNLGVHSTLHKPTASQQHLWEGAAWNLRVGDQQILYWMNFQLVAFWGRVGRPSPCQFVCKECCRNVRPVLYRSANIGALFSLSLGRPIYNFKSKQNREASVSLGCCCRLRVLSTHPSISAPPNKAKSPVMHKWIKEKMSLPKEIAALLWCRTSNLILFRCTTQPFCPKLQSPHPKYCVGWGWEQLAYTLHTHQREAFFCFSDELCARALFFADPVLGNSNGCVYGYLQPTDSYKVDFQDVVKASDTGVSLRTS